MRGGVPPPPRTSPGSGPAVRFVRFAPGPDGHHDRMLTLYQAEWCPYSSAVRERLTELGLPFVAVPVEPEPEAREELRRVADTDEIPVLVTDDGEVLAGTDTVLGWLASRRGPGDARHRQRFAEHVYQRDGTAARVLGQSAPVDG